MSKPIIKEIEQKTYTIKHTKIRELNDAVERVDRGIRMVSTALYLLASEKDMYTNFGRSMEVGLYELASELEDRYDELEKISFSLTQKERKEE